MKHIKKKYLFQKKLENNEKEKLSKFANQIGDLKKIDIKKQDLYVTNDEDFIIKAIPFKNSTSNNISIIPIPDLTLVYFDSAYNLNVRRKAVEKLLFEKLKPTENRLGEDVTNEIFQYYGNASTCIISLFTCIESFINHIIPDDKEFIKTNPNRKEIYNKEQIQKNLQFEIKIKEVLPQLINKRFEVKSLVYQDILRLKVLRDSIVHTKSDLNFKLQEELFQNILKFPYDKMFDSVAKFINFYKDDYITECSCGIDF